VVNRVSRTRRALLRAVLPALGVLAGTVPQAAAQAARVSVAPTTVKLARQNASGLVTLTNSGAAVADFQASVHAWSSGAGGAIVLDPTGDLVVAPTVFRLEPGQSRRVRVLSRTPAGPRERTYRLLFSQLPDPAQAGRVGVAMRMELSLPVFVPPTRRSVSVLVPGAEITAGRLTVRLRNAGNATLTPQHVTMRLLDRDGAVITSDPVDMWYVLPGEERTLVTVADAAACTRASHVGLELTVDGDRFTVNAALRKDGASCGR